MVVPKECFHLGSLIDDRHHGEVVGIVPTPGDVEEVSFLTWNVIKGVIGCWVGNIGHGAFCEIAPIANINLEIVRAGVRVGAIS